MSRGRVSQTGRVHGVGSECGFRSRDHHRVVHLLFDAARSRTWCNSPPFALARGRSTCDTGSLRIWSFTVGTVGPIDGVVVRLATGITPVVAHRSTVAGTGLRSRHQHQHRNERRTQCAFHNVSPPQQQIVGKWVGWSKRITSVRIRFGKCKHYPLAEPSIFLSLSVYPTTHIFTLAVDPNSSSQQDLQLAENANSAVSADWLYRLIFGCRNCTQALTNRPCRTCRVRGRQTPQNPLWP